MKCQKVIYLEQEIHVYNSHILNEISKNYWAISGQAFDSLLDIVNRNDLNKEQIDSLHTLDNNIKVNAFSLLGESVDGTQYSSVLNRTGFITVYGPIVPRSSFFSRASGVASYTSLIDEFKALEDNSNIDQIVFILDTPGGSTTGVNDLSSLIYNSKKETASFAWMAASAGYEIASATDRIYGPATGIFGSIGTVATITDTKKRDAKNGVTQYEIVSTQSPYKRADVTTDEGRAIVQRLVDDMAQHFIENVAKYRGVSTEKVLNDFGKGAVFSGDEAIKRGMIDDVLQINDFVNLITKTRDSNRLFTLNSNKENNMSNEATQLAVNEITVDTLRSTHPNLVKDIEQSAIAAYTAKLKSIEVLADEYEEYGSNVYLAVRAVIDTLKYDNEVREHTIGVEIIKAASKAFKNQTNTFKNDVAEATNIVSNIGSASPSSNTTVDKEVEVTNRLVAAGRHLGGE